MLLPAAAVALAATAMAVPAANRAPGKHARASATFATTSATAAASSFGRLQAGTAWYSMSANYKRSSRFQLSESGTVTDVVAYLDGLGGTSGSQQLRYGVYADDAGRPGTLLAQTGVVTIAAGQAAGWVRAAATSPAQLAPGWYHLALQSGSSGGVARYSRASLSQGLVSNSDAFSDGLASPYGSATADNWQVAIHALLGAPQAPDAEPPSAPGAPTVTSSSATSLSLSWTASTDNVGVTGYGAYVDGARSAETSAKSYTFTGLACDTGYTLAVDAFDAAGNRSARSTASARTAACASPLQPPQNLRVSGVTATSLTVAWDAVSGATKYGAYLNGTRVAEPTVTSFTFSGLTCGTSYTVGADAADLAGNRSAITGLTTATAACPPPPPPAGSCTKTLAAGGSLGTFLNGLKAGEVGCLRGGTHSGGDSVTWSASGGTVQAYPGEQPVVSGTRIVISGSDQTLRGFTIKDVLFTDGEPVQISGTRARVEGMELANANEHGILLNTSARDATIVRNYIHDVGNDTLDHGIYVQGSGHVITNNLIARPTGYGIHLYSSPSNVVVAQNTLVASTLRAGILIRTSGTGIRVVNNVFAGNATHGINYHSCGGGCVIDDNVAWNNPSGAVSSAGATAVTNTTVADPQFADAAYRVAATSPAVDSARLDYSYGPDRDGVGRPQGGAPDKGAYERAR